MQFFDYDNDLQTFNTLMEDVKDIELIPDDIERVIHLEAATDSGGIDAAKIIDKITSAILSNADVRTKLFKSSYWKSKEPPFELATLNDIVITNDSDAPKLIEKKDDTHYTVNLSRLIYQKTKPAYFKTLNGMSDWSSEVNKLIGPFGVALNQATSELKKVATKYLKDPNTAGNSFDKKRDAEDEDKVELDTKTTEKPDNTDDVAVPDDNDTDVVVPDDGGDVNQKKLYAKIMKDFRENHLQDIEIECDENKEHFDDAIRQNLLDTHYDELMEPYWNQADDNTHSRVKKAIEFYINKYSRKSDEKKESNEPEEDEMDWSGKKKTNPNETKPWESSDETSDDSTNNTDKGYGNWFANTMNNWSDEGVINNKLNPIPATKGASAAKQASYAARDKETKRLKEKLHKKHPDWTDAKLTRRANIMNLK